MSDHSHAPAHGHSDSHGHAAPAIDPNENPAKYGRFDKREELFFQREDAVAAAAIGKLLVGFFFYSVIAMTVVTLWTAYVAFK